MTARKNVAPRTYSIEECSIKSGLPMRYWRLSAGSPGFPASRAGLVGGYAGPVFDGDAVDAWIAARRAEIAEYPSRWEAGPYKSAERAEVTARRMNIYSVGAVPVEINGEHFVFVCVPDGKAPADVGDNLRELFPTVEWRCYDFGPCEPCEDWLDA